jgi:hypothetical protein
VTRLCAAAVGLCVLWGSGCAKPYVRGYEWQGEGVALRDLADRAARVRSVRAACGLTLTDGRGEAVNLDGALVVRVDEQDRVWLRLRAWKLGHAVLDLTVRPDGVWLVDGRGSAGQASSDPGQAGLAGVKPEQLAQAWRLFMGGFFSDPDVHAARGQKFIVTKKLEEGGTVACLVDPATLTPSLYVVRDEAGRERQRLVLEQYREVGPEAIAFPMRVTADGPGGRVEARLEDVELNEVLEESVFTPPTRAVKQP